MSLDLAAILVGILGGIVTVATYILKRKAERKEDQDALATVEANEVEAGMDRVDAIDSKRMRDEEGKN